MSSVPPPMPARPTVTSAPPPPSPSSPTVVATTQDVVLDPAALIASSRARGARLQIWPLLLIGLTLMFLLSNPEPGASLAVARVVALLVFAGTVIGMGVVGRRLSRRLAAEGEAVTALDELVQLRRWPEAADLASRLLGRSMLLPGRRMDALMSFATVLARYHRFADARAVHDYLLDPANGDLQPDPPTAHAIRVARAMSLLREDYLVDADRAMADLRRDVSVARDGVRRSQGNDEALKIQSAGLVLLDLYRDVKTGHPEEAIAIFERSKDVLRDQLGTRVADGWILAAAAYDRLGRTAEAQQAYANATALAPAIELHRRYPETAPLSDRYQPTPTPAGVQG